MGIRFDLARAHPDYRPLVEGILGRLAERHPRAPLRTVTVYLPRAGDRSLGSTDPDGRTIRLNGYWFAEPPSVLEDAAVGSEEVSVLGRPVLWHGPMLEEPLHVLTHEFGHSLCAATPGWEDRARAAWDAATRDPWAAPSGYSLTDHLEMAAECFAMRELGFL